MDVSIEKLNEEWKKLRIELKEKQLRFDEEYRQKNKNHDCKTKVISHNGEWFCEHLTKARYHKLKEPIIKEEKIISSIINLTN